MINENNEWQPSKINSDYAVSKYLSELEVWRGFSEGLKGAILNPSLIIGAGFWNNGTGEFFKIIKKGLSFYPVGTNGFVDVRDVADMSIKLMESEINEERYICSAINVKHKDFLSKIAKQLGKKPPSIKLNSFVLKNASVLLDLYNFLIMGKSNLSSQSLKNASFNSYYDNSKSINKLNYSYIPIDKTISDTCNAFVDSVENRKEFAVFKS
jgi:nucleoside-diphosphate-sugar epimerase